MNKALSFAVVGVLIMFIVAGCSSENDAGTENDESKPSTENVENGENEAMGEEREPVTLSVFLENPALTIEQFEELIAGPVQEAHPHISFSFVQPSEDLHLPELITAGEIPDLSYTTPYIDIFLEHEVALDLRELIDEHGLDLSGIYPEIMASIEKFGENGEIYSLPFMNQSFSMWYNTDIFDSFGVQYPTDGMTWHEAIDLAADLTREEDGIQYHGLSFLQGGITNFASPLSIDVWDPDAQEPIVSDEWAVPFDIAQTMIEIPGNRPDDFFVPGLFIHDQVLAMAPYWTGAMITELEHADSASLNWDVVQVPSFEQSMDQYYQADYHQWIVSRTSEHLDDVMEVINIALSEEVQTKSARIGKEPVLDDPAILDQFGADLEHLQGKNVEGIHKSGPAEMIEPSRYNWEVFGAINDAFMRVLDEDLDINSALREAEEDARQRVSNMQASE